VVTKMKKITKETVRRALRTFLQALTASFLADIVTVDFSEGREVIKSTVISFSVSAVAAGISAVMNLENKEENENV